jgi:hypothetical protein
MVFEWTQEMERRLCEKMCGRLTCYSREERSRKREERPYLYLKRSMTPCNDAAQAPVFGRPRA